MKPRWSYKPSEHSYQWSNRAIVEGVPGEWSFNVYYPDWDNLEISALAYHRSHFKTVAEAKARAERVWTALSQA